jgi:hypothetical protein
LASTAGIIAAPVSAVAGEGSTGDREGADNQRGRRRARRAIDQGEARRWLEGAGRLNMFDTFAMVDWSAANQPKQGRDSIWICWHAPDGERLANPETRHKAKALLADWLAAARANDERVLVGFDFPFGYPAGFAARLGLTGPPWRAIWDEIARLIEDREDNRNNRFEVGAALNRRVSGEQFPFWGCPAGAAGRYLAPTRPAYEKGLAENRLIDTWMVGAQPCWKLFYTGSVGGQVLTGIPVARALRDDPRWADRARVWPFETGLGIGDDARVVFAEIWPSWWQARSELGPPNDKAQVRTVARFLAERDGAGELAALFAGDPGLSPSDRRRIETEEAWTLGVTAARQRRIGAPHPTPEQPLTMTELLPAVPKERQ